MILQLSTHKEDLVVSDTTCDIIFMMKATEELGEFRRKPHHWVLEDEPIHLFMDNAWRCSTKFPKIEYVDILKTHSNVEMHC